MQNINLGHRNMQDYFNMVYWSYYYQNQTFSHSFIPICPSNISMSPNFYKNLTLSSIPVQLNVEKDCKVQEKQQKNQKYYSTKLISRERIEINPNISNNKKYKFYDPSKAPILTSFRFKMAPKVNQLKKELEDVEISNKEEFFQESNQEHQYFQLSEPVEDSQPFIVVPAKKLKKKSRRFRLALMRKAMKNLAKRRLNSSNGHLKIQKVVKPKLEPKLKKNKNLPFFSLNRPVLQNQFENFELKLEALQKNQSPMKANNNYCLLNRTDLQLLNKATFDQMMIQKHQN